MSIVFGRKWSLFVAAVFLVGCPENGEEDNQEDPTNSISAQCDRGENRSPETATAITFGESESGFICPIGDSRWYSFSVASGAPLVEVTAGMTTALTAVELTYEVYEAGSGGSQGPLVAQARLEDVGGVQALNAMECLGAGDYLIRVRDFRENNQDFVHPYELVVETHAEPDANAPNDDADQAVALTAEQAVEGYISCRGDQDWFVIDVGEREVVEFRLSMDQSPVRPFVEVRNEAGEQVARADAASDDATAEIVRRFAPSGAGPLYFVVGDVEGEAADLEVPYSLEVELIEDIDPNEPNDTASEATPLNDTPVSCGGSWSQYYSTWGTISAPGDQDWFRLPIQGCEGGLVEAEMVFNTSGMNNTEKWELSETLQAELVLVVPDETSSCTADSECDRLAVTCSNDLHCSGFGENCDMASGTCVGGRACLQEGHCGGNQVRRRYECPEFLSDCVPSSDRRPEPNRAVISAPIFGGDAIYLRAGDFQSQASEPDLRYDLRVRVRSNPDGNEPNNLFMDNVDSNLPISAHQEFAQPVTVHDCTGASPSCCGSGTWNRGRISYQNDMDWFFYQHPCPDEDCTLRFHYEVDAGPVDVRMDVFRERTQWQTMLFHDQADNNPATSGTVGGLDADATCYYASQLHSGEEFTYYINVRDQFEVYPNGLTVVESSRDWDPDQEYRFCIEKVSNICEEPPCYLYDDGCGPP